MLDNSEVVGCLLLSMEEVKLLNRILLTLFDILKQLIHDSWRAIMLQL